jgi:hypothetical protein
LISNVLAALEQGSQIQCHEKQYPAIRAVLSSAAEKVDEGNISAQLARSEIERLDQAFNWKQLSTD